MPASASDLDGATRPGAGTEAAARSLSYAPPDRRSGGPEACAHTAPMVDIVPATAMGGDPATAWRTGRYFQQFPVLKKGLPDGRPPGMSGGRSGRPIRPEVDRRVGGAASSLGTAVGVPRYQG